MAKKPDNRYIRYYTAGSAARKLAPQVQELPKAAPRTQKAKRVLVYIDPVAILGIVTALFMLVCLVVGLVQWNEARTQQAIMADYVHELTVTNGELTRQYHQGIDLKQIETSALALGMVPAEQVEHISVQVSAD